jgi:hypothetical protein
VLNTPKLLVLKPFSWVHKIWLEVVDFGRFWKEKWIPPISDIHYHLLVPYGLVTIAFV